MPPWCGDESHQGGSLPHLHQLRNALTKDKNDFKKKIYALITAKRLRLFDQAFGAPMRVMITTPSNKRMNTLMSWTSEALVTMAGEPEERARFFFTDRPVNGEMTAEDLFLSPLWYQFDTDDRVPLFAIAGTPVARQISRLPNERGSEHHDHRDTCRQDAGRTSRTHATGRAASVASVIRSGPMLRIVAGSIGAVVPPTPSTPPLWAATRTTRPLAGSMSTCAIVPRNVPA